MKLSSKAQKRKFLGYKLSTQENSNSTLTYYLLHPKIYLSFKILFASILFGVVVIIAVVLLEIYTWTTDVTTCNSMAHFTWYNKHNLPQSNVNRADTEHHVPLCSITDVQLRFLVPDDLTEVRTLCQDWFPIDYPLSWYEDITSSSRFFALAAVYNLAIIGLIVAEIKPYRNLNKEDKGILPDSMGRNADIGYILSLGVHRKHRRNGIGSLLLDSLLNHLTTAERHSVKAIFLHVLTTNQPAIQFYEKRRFHLHSFLPYYYNIRGKGKDGFTYVTYINGGHQPWTLLDHIKHYVSKLQHAGAVFTWISTRLRQVVRWICHKTVSRFNFAH